MTIRNLTDLEIFYLARQQIKNPPDQNGMSHLPQQVAALLDAFDPAEFARKLALERCPPITLTAPVAVALIKAALGQQLTGPDTAALTGALINLEPAGNLEQAIKTASNANAINTAAGGNLWPT